VRWLADECVSARLVVLLREGEEDVAYMADVAPGAPDTELLERAVRESRLLLTDDKDFGELVVRGRHAVPGLVLMRIGTDDHGLRWQRLDAAIRRFGEGLFGRYTIIEEARFRYRPLAFDQDRR
jgi:predicted nuclease of predicted toxin-antitoxin system